MKQNGPDKTSPKVSPLIDFDAILSSNYQQLYKRSKREDQVVDSDNTGLDTVVEDSSNTTEKPQVSPTPYPGWPGPPIETGLPVGPSLGQVLSVFTLLVFIFYTIGMVIKFYKLHIGTYEEESPVYLMYK